MALRVLLRIGLVSMLVSIFASSLAQAHWCDDLWGSDYNIVVKTASDTVAVSSTGSATLDLYVQNNMGYPLYNFIFEPKAPSDFMVSVEKQTPKVPNYLMPGEKLKYTLTISKSGGGQLSVSTLQFNVTFGNNRSDERLQNVSPPLQGCYYGTGGSGTLCGNAQADPFPLKTRAVVVKTPSGTIPSTISTVSGNSQALHLQASANADYGDLHAGIDALLQQYCAGRGSWNNNDTPAVIASNCPDAHTQSCPGAVAASRGDTKWDYQHLWAAGELAYRLAGRTDTIGTQHLPVLRARLICGWNDGGGASLSFKAFVGFILGYLGDDTGASNSAHDFLQGVVTNGTANEKAIARAALLLMAPSSDDSQVRAILAPGTGSSIPQVRMVAAAALGIAKRDDQVVTNELIATAGWVEPEAGDSGKAFLAAHLLNLVAWSQRGWAPNAADTGEVTFYGGDGGMVPYDGGGGGGGGGGGAKSSGGGGCGFAAGGAATALTAAWLLLALWRRRRA